MKKIFLIILLTILLFLNSCSSDSIIGKWKAVRKNSSAEANWKNIDNGSLEFFSDGGLEINEPDKTKTIRGKYIVDTNISPHRFVFDVDFKIQGIYKIEGKKLVLKICPKPEFPSDFGIQENCDVVEYERK